MFDAHSELYCIIGNPVKHSLSPIIFNAAFNFYKLNKIFLAFEVSNLKAAMLSLKALGIKGISVTIPHKVEVLKYVDEIDKSAEIIGAANTILNKNGKLLATNTDWIAALSALEKLTQLTHKKVALIGAGGAARAILYGLLQRKAQVLLFNRTTETVKKLANYFNLTSFYGLSHQHLIAKCDIVINATSVGMHPLDKTSVVDKKFLNSKQIVFDIVYTPKMTKLISEAKSIGAKIITGDKMLLATAIQFKLFTGKKAPVKLIEKIIKVNLK